MTAVPGGWVRAFAPASVSNVTCGFDLLGFAISGLGDIVQARAVSEPGVRLSAITGDGGRLPTDPRQNTAGVAALELLAGAEEVAAGVELRLEKGLPLASGVGSSAASAVAAAVATNAALDLHADADALLAAAVEGERIASGTPHPDNAAPSLHGGLLLVRPGAPPAITPLRVPTGLTCVLLHPPAEVETEAARSLLPASVSRDTAVLQAGNLAALVAGLESGNYELIASAMIDHVAEPVRSALTPGFEAVRGAALEAGALGCGLSGSGPTMFAWSRNEEQATDIEAAMCAALGEATGLAGGSLISPVVAPGARILPEGEACGSRS